MLTNTFLKEEIILLVDFNSLDKNDLLSATLRYAIFLRRPAVSDWVRLDDQEGHTCLGRVESITGELIKVSPYWDTWTTETKTAKFSGSYASYPRTEVRGTEESPHTTGVDATVRVSRAGH